MLIADRLMIGSILKIANSTARHVGRDDPQAVDAGPTLPRGKNAQWQSGQAGRVGPIPKDPLPAHGSESLITGMGCVEFWKIQVEG